VAVDNVIFGWFDDASQTEPTYEPPRDAPCLFCGFKVTAADIRTHSLVRRDEYGARSYFYRTHRTCAEACSLTMDGFVLDMIARASE
jgi:hypothetical protein